jgi:poly-gamma-glutamate synthesis protein (capsule biosynthesis protein)
MKRTHSYKIVLIALILILLFSFNTASISAQLSEPDTGRECLINDCDCSIAREAELQGDPSQIRLIFVGDIMLDRGVEDMIEQEGGGDFRFPFFEIADYLNQADIVFGNLESLVSDKGRRMRILCAFRADPRAIEGLTYAGFDVLSVANNHIGDYGRTAMKDNFEGLEQAGIDYVGGGFSRKEAHSPVIKNIKGTKIAYLAYTKVVECYLSWWIARGWIARRNLSGTAWLTRRNLREDILEAKKQADLVIVSMHFGREYRSQPTLRQRKYAHLAIDYGADLVIGHHPHVVQPIEAYKGGYIAYSLGNFVFDQSGEETKKGLLLEVLIEGSEIIEVNPRDIKINEFFQPGLE